MLTVSLFLSLFTIQVLCGSKLFRQRDFQQADCIAGRKGHGLSSTGEEYDIAAADGTIAAAMLDLPGTLNANQHARHMGSTTVNGDCPSHRQTKKCSQ